MRYKAIGKDVIDTWTRASQHAWRRMPVITCEDSEYAVTVCEILNSLDDSIPDYPTRIKNAFLELEDLRQKMSDLIWFWGSRDILSCSEEGIANFHKQLEHMRGYEEALVERLTKNLR